MPLGKYAKQTFKSIKKATLNKPALFLLGLKIISNQRQAVKKRDKYFKQGLQVPAFLIFSVTNHCNLNCKGCYHQAQRKKGKEELDDEKIERILAEAEDLGIANVVLAGGEPLLRKNLLDIAGRFPKMLFLLVTNGTLINKSVIDKLEKTKNIIPIISIEGEIKDTDFRRGSGIHQKVLRAMENLSKSNIVFGNSITVTRKNLQVITSEKFVEDLIGRGVSVLFYSDYVPVAEGTKNLMPTTQERKITSDRLKKFRELYPAVFFSMADEDEFGGCASAGIGFLHINPSGDVEPCPMSPVSDVNLNHISLKDALNSKLLKKIRANRSMLAEHDGGCALYSKREWVKSLIDNN